MSEHDIKALEANFAVWHKERAPQATVADAFELYCIDHILKNADLSDEEVQAGNIGGPDDGGVDGAYLFVNTKVISDESAVPDPAMTVNLILIQARTENAFKEEAIEKLYAFSRDMFNWNVAPDTLTYLNSEARDFIATFRKTYDAVVSDVPRLYVNYIYVAKTDSAAHPKVNERIAVLKKLVSDNFSSANVGVFLWGCRDLLGQVRSSPRIQKSIEVTKFFPTDEGAFVCLAKLKSFADFLSDDKGDIKRSILEPNIRDYQGKRNPVNTDIRKTLDSSDGKEFWWFNNGVTILATNPSVGGNKLTMESPEVVNGLQTSREIFDYFKENPQKADSRNVLIRVLVPSDEQLRTRITKATNFQTEVEPLSLRATDPIHFDIEDRLKLYQLFYDRRKGQYRDLRKSVAQIVSIRAMAQAVIACVLQRPNDARARPQSLLNNDNDYKAIFHPDYNREVFAAAILIDRRVDQYLKSTSLGRDLIRDVRYYVDTWATCSLTKKAHPTSGEIATTANLIPSLTDDMLLFIGEYVVTLYKKLGGTDKVAKGPELKKELLSEIEKLFPEKDDSNVLQVQGKAE